MSKKALVIIIVAALVGGFFGSITASRFAQADLSGNIWDFITGSNATSTLKGAPAKTTTLYAPTIDYEQAVVNAVEKASPSVVSIVISKDLPVINSLLSVHLVISRRSSSNFSAEITRSLPSRAIPGKRQNRKWAAEAVLSSQATG